MSAMGSFTMVVSSPARLGHARDVAAERVIAQADSAHLELAVVAPWTPADSAAIAMPNLELGSLFQLCECALACHVCLPQVRTGMPRPRSSARACSSVLAVVTKVMFMP